MRWLLILLMSVPLLAADGFESVCVIPGFGTTPSGDGWTEDQVYAVVKRTINGVTVRYVEQFTPLEWGSDDDYCWFVDCAARGSNRYQPGVPETGVSGVPGEYPTLRATTEQVDPGLTHTTAISNVTELQAMENGLTGNYYLTGDIDASATTGWNGGAGFDPVGSSLLAPFTGTFDGCGYTITGLFINRPTTNYNALFGYIEDPAQIANVTLASCDITGSRYNGALVGAISRNNSSTALVQNCHSSGTISFPTGIGSRYGMGGLIGEIVVNGGGTANVYDCSSSCTVDVSTTTIPTLVGGFIGSSNGGTISNCFATGNVTGSTVGNTIGGFVGSILGTTFTYCYATGDVSGSQQVGGFAGYSSDPTDVMQKCYATGDATSSGALADETGGFIGQGEGGSITDCYAWGDVTCDVAGGRVGGFAGVDTTGTATFTNCYSIGAATGLLNPGGFIEDGTGNTYSDCYWDTEASGNATSDGGTGQTTAWIKNKTNFPATWDYDTIWYNPYTADTTVPAVPESWSDDEATPLDGETVCVYADGIPRGEYVMDGNDLAGFTEESYDVVIAGLNYWSIYESERLGYVNDYGPTYVKQGRIYSLMVDFDKTMGADIGVDSDNVSSIQFSDDDWATAIDAYVGYKGPLVFPRDITRDPHIYVEIWEPVPMTIRGLHVTMESYEN